MGQGRCNLSERTLEWRKVNSQTSFVHLHPEVRVLILKLPIAVTSRKHQFLVRIVRLAKVGDALLEVFDVVLGPLSNGSLRLPIVRTLPLQLCGRQGAHTPRASA